MFEVPQRQQLASEDSVPETPSYGTELSLGAKSSTCRTGRIFSARNGPRSDVSKHKKRVLIKVYQDFLGTLLSLIVLYSD